MQDHSAAFNRQFAAAAANYDNASPPEDGFDLVGYLQGEGVPAWLAEAVFEAITGDVKFLERQVVKHVPEWTA